MKAERVIRERIVFGDGAILEMKVWRVPVQVPGSRHMLKYSLFYGRPGERLIGYDNERGKGDHRHCGEREEAYTFVSIEQMLLDFQADVERLRGERI
ncbi:toxin-antitoxin system TumE family protein [Rhizobium sp. 21-4511-3d]